MIYIVFLQRKTLKTKTTMKKFFLMLAIAGMAIAANAQTKFEVKDFGKFKLHTYVTADR